MVVEDCSGFPEGTMKATLSKTSQKAELSIFRTLDRTSSMTLEVNQGEPETTRKF